MSTTTYTFYFAGELFSQKHLIGNALLGREIYERSENVFLPVLPQDLEFRSVHPKDIRDHDLLSLLRCDLALFHFDGPELDSGTVVEFMMAKFADIPSVILRTDFREGGDQAGEGDPWNLMCSFYPRTETLSLSCLKTAAEAGHRRQSMENYQPDVLQENITAQLDAVTSTAEDVIRAFRKVLQEPPVLRGDLCAPIYDHLMTFPNYAESPEKVKVIIETALQQKKEKGLL